MTGLVRQAEELGLYEATDGVNPLRSGLPSPDELADALQVLDSNIKYAPGGRYAEVARVVTAELGRLRLVEQAASALVEHWERLHPHDVETVRQVTLGTLVTLVDALAAAVRGEEERG
jgi:hypothetical protein